MKYVFLYIVLTSFFLMGCAVSEGKPQIAKKWIVEDSVVIKGYDFVNMEADTIIDPKGTLTNFYNNLNRLSEQTVSSGFQVSILHYGDSHIQAGDITGVVMRRMQNRFGNAGRGLVMPHRLTKSNEPLDYKIVTPNNFAKARLLDLNPETTIGVGGIGVKSADSQQQFSLIMLKNSGDTTNYDFNRVVVFHDPLAPIITAKEELLADGGGVDKDMDFVTEINLLEKTDTLLLYTYVRDEYKDGAFYGFSTENGRSGVLYHAMGINGAAYVHWGRKPEVAKQSKALDPELIIISMGANEASGRNFIEDVFYREVDSFVRKLREVNPSAAILLTTPPEAMRMSKRTASPNPNYEKIRNTILKYGTDKGVAVFDMYGATGGSGSSKMWVENKLMQRDKIHFTPEGYRIQGLLIYGAILDGFVKGKSKKSVKSQTQRR